MKDDDLVESLRAENRRLIKRLEKNGIDWQLVPTPKVVPKVIRTELSKEEKLTLFGRLFRGRSDVFPVRWENSNSGKSGYSPVCLNDRKPGICRKPAIKCGDCAYFA
ncbi:MAG: hypothetical protein EB012_10880 [Gammaproteobacteria bacterium]|nr:hypothetical protein [Gammaproteobacteria bacterium]